MKRSAFYFDVSKLTDEELADLIHELNNELGRRSCHRRDDESWFKHSLRTASLSVRSWSSAKQSAMRGTL